MDDATREEAVASYVADIKRYQSFAEALRVLLSQLLLQAGVAVVSLEARAKDPASLRDKLARRPHYGSLDDVPDLCGARVITRYISEISSVERLLEDEFVVVERVVHGATSAEAFGYVSTHVIVELKAARAGLLEWSPFRDIRAEIQVRTILQHSWAMISHGLDYKSAIGVPEASRRTLFRVAAMLETSDELFESYRQQVEQARETYAEEAARDDDDWSKLEINLDSLRAFWERLPVESVRSVAVESGFTPWGSAASELRDEEALAQMISVLTKFGCRTLEELNTLMETIAEAGALLSLFVDEVREGPEDQPYAIVPDVVVITVMEVRPEYADQVPLYFPAPWRDRWRSMVKNILPDVPSAAQASVANSSDGVEDEEPTSGS